MLNNSPGDIVLEHHDRCRGRVNGVCYQGRSEVVDEETDNVEFDNMGSVLLKNEEIIILPLYMWIIE